MIARPNSFKEGIDWRRLSVAEGKGKYRFVTLKPIRFPSPVSLIPHPISFRDGDNREWMRICPHFVLTAAGYSWNGSSPKKGIRIGCRDAWFGTPDFLPTIPASLVHDGFFQFSSTKLFPFSVDFCNDAYKSVCEAGKFKLTHVYDAALDGFSKNFFGRPPKNGEHAVEL